MLSQLSSMLSPSQTSFHIFGLVLQFTKIWTILSTSQLHKPHLLGPSRPLLQRLSQVRMTFSRHSQIKQVILLGNFHCQIIRDHQRTLLDDNSYAIESYMSLALKVPDVNLPHIIKSSVSLKKIHGLLR